MRTNESEGGRRDARIAGTEGKQGKAGIIAETGLQSESGGTEGREGGEKKIRSKNYANW